MRNASKEIWDRILLIKFFHEGLPALTGVVIAGILCLAYYTAKIYPAAPPTWLLITFAVLTVLIWLFLSELDAYGGKTRLKNFRNWTRQHVDVVEEAVREDLSLGRTLWQLEALPETVKCDIR